MTYQRGDVVWGPDPFKSGENPRPWLILNNDTHPFSEEEYRVAVVLAFLVVLVPLRFVDLYVSVTENQNDETSRVYATRTPWLPRRNAQQSAINPRPSQEIGTWYRYLFGRCSLTHSQ